MARPDSCEDAQQSDQDHSADGHAAGFPAGEGEVLWWSLALGADLGGNATAIGAWANVVILGMAERAGNPVSFWQFTRYGLIVTVITIALCVPYLWLRYFAFA
jgi:Na+/H+ antiporter NhaD/arsenite permease-like protein